MKLYHSATSLYVRARLASAHELGLAAHESSCRLLRRRTQQPRPGARHAQPTSKAPTLLTEDGTVLYTAA